MNIRIIEDIISLEELKTVGREFYESMVKGVVDTEKRIVVFGGEYHADANNVLIEHGSRQEHIWGFNIQFDLPRGEWVECISLINIRPAAGNRTMEIEDPELRATIVEIVNEKII